jgi:hypothetical protein
MMRWHQRLGLGLMIWGLAIQMTVPHVAHPSEPIWVAVLVLAIGFTLMAAPERKRS